MGGFETKRYPVSGGPRGDDGGASDSVSELSVVASLQSQYSDVSKLSSRASPLRLLRASAKIAGRMKRLSSSGSKTTMDSAGGVDNELDSSVGSVVVTDSHLAENQSPVKQSLLKSAKSSFNMGVVFLKTGDYTKALENLEQSLYAHLQLSGHDAKSYTPDTLLAVAAVHEKLGDCFAYNSEMSDNYLALDHYQESRKLLQSIEPGEDAPEQMQEMLERVNEKLILPLLFQEASPKRPEMKVKKSLLRFGTNANTVRIVTPPSSETKKSCLTRASDHLDGTSERALDLEPLSDTDIQCLARAMSYLDRNDHQAAFNYLKSIQIEKSMDNPDFRARMESNMLTVASSALEAGNASVATNAYEELLNLLVQNHRTELNSMLILRGCINAHKAMALKMESIMDYGSAIQRRIRVVELLDESDNFILACNQLLKIANLYGEQIGDYDQCTSTLADVERRLLEKSPSLESMPVECTNVLIQCYRMGAICFSKANKWDEAVHQYNALIPLLANTKGQDCQEYNAASIQKAALLVKIGDYDDALTIIIEYFDLVENSVEKIIAEDSDHILAMDVYTSLLLYVGDINKAKDMLEKKLEFLDRHPQKDEIKSDAMYKLGCLLAFLKEHRLAIPFLSEALDSRKRLFDGSHKAVFESTWAVATTAQSLGDTERSLNAYSELVNKNAVAEDLPLNIIRIHILAGKLFFDDGDTGKSVVLFRQALHEAESCKDDQQKHVAELNLANALSVQGMSDEAMELYDRIVCTKTVKLSKIFFMALVNKSALLLKMGELEEAYKILCKVEDTNATNADEVRGRVYLLLGIVAFSSGKFIDARSYFEDSLDMAEGDLSSIVLAKKCISLAYMASRQYKKAIFTLDDLLGDVSGQSVQSKSMNVAKADIWNFMARVYRAEGNLSEAKNFVNLALQTYRTVLGETHPTTLRNVSNLQVLLLEESEGLDRNEAMFFIDVTKYEMEEILEAFESMNEPSTYRFELVSLRINLGFVAVWQGKPKRARKYLRQIKALEIPSDHLLLQRIVNLEDSVEQLENKRFVGTSYIID